jgi:hypothetical protein
MTIAVTDLKFYLSGGASNADPGGDQGGTISSVQVPEQILSTTPFVKNTMFNDVSSTNRIAGITQYRCFYLKNTHATQTASNIKMFKNPITNMPDTVSIGYSGNAVNTPEQLITATTSKVYDVAVTTSDGVLNDTRKIRGEKVTATTAVTYNVPIAQVSLYLKRTGNPTGTFYVRQRASTNDDVSGTPLNEIGSMDVSTIATTATKYTFTATTTRALALNDAITYEYSNGTSSNYISVFRNTADPVAGSYEIYHDGTSWHNNTTYDTCGEVWKAGVQADRVAPTGVTFVNPIDLASAISLPNLAPSAYIGCWFKRVVPVNCSAKVGDNFQVSVQFESPTP